MVTSHSHLRSTIERLQPVLQSTAKNLLQHLRDDPIAQAQESFADFEDLHHQLVHRLALEIMQQALQQEADRLAALPSPNCPICDQPTQWQEPFPRVLQTDSGEVHWKEPQCSCGRCRKAFFPSDCTG